jgi:glucosamine--fructose-6-phosphate aminotransferase (isomerizing)
MATMMDEIMQQPTVLAGVRKYYASPGAIPEKALRKLAAKWPPVVVFSGMGSSLWAAYPAQAYLTSHGVRAFVIEAAELLHHHLKILHPGTLLVVVSQSGETVEMVRLLERVPPKVGVVPVVNLESSTVARRGGLLLPMMAGQQHFVSTKTYMCSVAVLMYLAFAILEQSQRPLTATLLRAVESQEKMLENPDAITAPTVEFFDEPSYVAMMARGADMASACQGAQMLKEVARIGAEAISAAQFRHGPIEIINPEHRYVIFARQGLRGDRNKTFAYLVRLADDVRAHGGRVLLYSDVVRPAETNMRMVTVEPMRLKLGTLIDTLAIQLLAHDLAIKSGFEPGRFWISQGVATAE